MVSRSRVNKLKNRDGLTFVERAILQDLNKHDGSTPEEIQGRHSFYYPAYHYLKDLQRQGYVMREGDRWSLTNKSRELWFFKNWWEQGS